MNEYEALSQRIDTLESVQIHELRNSVTDIKENLARNNVLVEQCVKSNEKLADTMSMVSETMTTITHSLQDLNKEIESFDGKLNETNVKMDEKFISLREEVELVDEKSKVDVLVWLRDNWKTVAVILASGGTVAAKQFGLF